MSMTYRKLEGYKYELLTDVMYPVLAGVFIESDYINLVNGILTVKKHYCWDGPSGPTFDTKTFMRGSLIHDALYQLIREGLLDKKYRDYADKLLRVICLDDGMSKFRAWYVYHSVRMFAGGGIKKKKKPRGQIVTIG